MLHTIANFIFLAITRVDILNNYVPVLYVWHVLSHLILKQFYEVDSVITLIMKKRKWSEKLSNVPKPTASCWWRLNKERRCRYDSHFTEKFIKINDLFMFTKLARGKIGSHRSKFDGFNKSSKNYLKKRKSRVLNVSRTI